MHVSIRELQAEGHYSSGVMSARQLRYRSLCQEQASTQLRDTGENFAEPVARLPTYFWGSCADPVQSLNTVP